MALRLELYPSICLNVLIVFPPPLSCTYIFSFNLFLGMIFCSFSFFSTGLWSFITFFSSSFLFLLSREISSFCNFYFEISFCFCFFLMIGRGLGWIGLMMKNLNIFLKKDGEFFSNVSSILFLLFVYKLW
jgi:hypothetical protein